ncbi:MAG: hypothetical protein SLAVMIC_00325 [uncultured marine phage]|uniref:Uncharacterized protein n=1 Tax=uncultured marine phage TaxID=707152 RepID=A0A8D9CDY9_9VIRU|nr:MAG: hypothetical protein SLAVMIC_00325 [uncultured marine phage]
MKKFKEFKDLSEIKSTFKKTSNDLDDLVKNNRSLSEKEFDSEYNRILKEMSTIQGMIKKFKKTHPNND